MHAYNSLTIEITGRERFKCIGHTNFLFSKKVKERKTDTTHEMHSEYKRGIFEIFFSPSQWDYFFWISLIAACARMCRCVYVYGCNSLGQRNTPPEYTQSNVSHTPTQVEFSMYAAQVLNI